MHKLAIIVPYWNSDQEFFSRLSLVTAKFPVFLFDNSGEIVASQSHTVFSSEQNSGFAHACNLSLVLKNYEYFLYLNPDVTISADQVETLLSKLQAEGFEAISPTFTDTNGNRQLDYQQSIPTFYSLLTTYSPLRKIFPMIGNTKTLPGGCLLLTRRALSQLNGWDERYWLWWEDSDLSYRMAQAGMKCGIAEHIQVQHIGGETFKPLPDTWKRWVFFHSLRIFIRKHFPTWQQLILFALIGRFDTHKLYPADPQIDLSVVVPNVREELLDAFLRENAADWNWEKHELIVVTSVQDLSPYRKKYPNIIFIVLKKNTGFAGTVNIGFRRARGAWLATVNDDTLLTPQLWKDLLASADDRTGSLNPVIYKPNGSIESAGIHVLAKGKALPLAEMQDNNQPYETDATNAAVVLYNRTALEKVGLYDERFGSYLEDIDLSLRLNRAGYKNVVVPTAKAIHIGQSTSKKMGRKKRWYDFRNWILVILKNWGAKKILLNAPAVLLERLRNFWGIFK